MKVLNALERRLSPVAIPRLTLILVMGQAAAYIVERLQPELVEVLYLDPKLVLQGEIWRLVSFLFTPPCANPLCLIFGLYIFLLMGNALEDVWGTFRYNVYLFVAWLATVGAAFLLFENGPSTAFIGGTVFLAFAHLYPDFELYIFFLLPVKVKWLALIAWIGYGLALVFGGWSLRAFVGAALANYLIFFGKDVVARVLGARWRMEKSANRLREKVTAFHTCATCGITDKTHPKTEFRVCSQCKGGLEYCIDHIRRHEHVPQD